MKNRWKKASAACALCLLSLLLLSSCSLIRSLLEGEETESPYHTEGEIDVSQIELKDLAGKWVDINSSTCLEFKGSRMIVTFGEWTETYKVKMEKTDYATIVKAASGDLGMMGEISVNKDGSLTAYEMILDGPSRQFRFVREDAVAAETAIVDLSKDSPKSIESRDIKSFSLHFENSFAGSYGLDESWSSGYYSWEITKSGGVYKMNFRISGDSYIILDYSEEVEGEYVKGLADLIVENEIPLLNGYHKKNNVQHSEIYLYVKYESGEKLTVHAEGDAARSCPFDLVPLLDYAYRKTGSKGWD